VKCAGETTKEIAKDLPRGIAPPALTA